MQRSTLCSVLVAATATLGVSTAMAIEGVSGAVAPESGGFVGLGVGYVPDYEGSDEFEAVPAPFGSYRWASGRYVELGGTSGSERAARLSVNVISKAMSETWKFGPLLQYRLKRDDVENNQVDAMEEVDAATEAGAFVAFKTGPWSASLAFAADISDEYDGAVAYFDGGYELLADSTWHVTLDVHLSYANDNYMETYFGVDSRNRGNSTLPDFEASADLKDTGLGLTAHYHFSKSWGLIGNVHYTRMLNDAGDSPLVDDEGDENQFASVLAVTYTF